MIEILFCERYRNIQFIEYFCRDKNICIYIYINNITQFYRFDLEFFFREYFQEIYNEAVIDSFEIFKNSRLQSYFA